MIKVLTRVVGRIVCESDGCRERCSIHSLYLTDSNGAGGEPGVSEDIGQGEN